MPTQNREEPYYHPRNKIVAEKPVESIMNGKVITPLPPFPMDVSKTSPTLREPSWPRLWGLTRGVEKISSH